jgi:hypothetical protein
MMCCPLKLGERAIFLFWFLGSFVEPEIVGILNRIT